MLRLDPLYTLAAVNGLLVVAIVCLTVIVLRLRNYVMRLNMERGKVVNEQLVALWHKRRNRLPPGSAKHRAYTARLREVGELE